MHPFNGVAAWNVTEIKHTISSILMKSIHKQSDRMEHVSICSTIEFQNASLLEFNGMDSKTVFSMG